MNDLTCLIRLSLNEFTGGPVEESPSILKLKSMFEWTGEHSSKVEYINGSDQFPLEAMDPQEWADLRVRVVAMPGSFARFVLIKVLNRVEISWANYMAQFMA
jgi:hypothetical protein